MTLDSGGASSYQSAERGGAAHILNFKGSDTFVGLDWLIDYYHDGEDEFPAFSIPATEHSTVTIWGVNGETDSYDNLLHKFPNGVVACVSDSYDIKNAVENIWGNTLKEKVLGRNGTLVVRPDSGDPAVQSRMVVEILGEKFGYSVNQKGYRVLNPKVRVIYGDLPEGSEDIKRILYVLEMAGWSADNIAFGLGGALLQKVNRDTQRFAIKACSAVIDGERVRIFKNPASDPSKASKAIGQPKLILENGEYKTVGIHDRGVDILEPVFRNGRILRHQGLNDMRRRCMVDGF